MRPGKYKTVTMAAATMPTENKKRFRKTFLQSYSVNNIRLWLGVIIRRRL